MSPKKLILYILLIFFGLAVAFCGLLYYTLRTTVNNVTNQQPFVTFIDKKMVLGNEAILVNNYEHFVYEEPLYLDAVGSQLYEGTSIEHQLKKGDTVTINAAKEFTNGVSGSTHTYLFGNVTTGNPPQTIPFEYAWETQTIEKNDDGIFVLKFELAEWEK